MNMTDGKTFLNENIGILKEYPYIINDKKCDVLIIGAGITGAITAFIQAKEGANVIIVDKNIVGFGATIENNGLLDTRVDFNNKTIKNISEKNISKCNDLCSEAKKILENIIEELNKDEDIKKYVSMIQYKSVDLLMFSDKITSKISTYKAFEKLSKENKEIEYLEEDPLINLRCGILFKDSGIILNPYILTELIFMYLEKMENVEIYENTEVVNINIVEDSIESITRNKFKIISKNVIITNGIYASKYIKDDKISLNKTFTVVSERVKELDQNVLDVVAKDIFYPNTMISFTKDKRIIITGEDIKQNEKMLNEEYFNHIAKGKYKKLIYLLSNLLNIDCNIKISNCFCGRYLNTRDGLPIIDEIDNLPGVYLNVGVGKNGIIYSLFGAKMLKDITKQNHIRDMYLFKENR